jgi:hypothetical protein
MEEIIKRLRQEKAESEAKATRLGQEKSERKQAEREAARLTGLEWAKTVHYDRLKEFGQLIEDARGLPHRPGASGSIMRLQELMNQLRWEGVDTGTVSTGGRTAGYDRDWQDGVLEFWKEVRDKL